MLERGKFSKKRRFEWKDLNRIGLDAIGLPKCPVIRLEYERGWFAFGTLLSDQERETAIAFIRDAYQRASRLGQPFDFQGKLGPD
jgi:hypothetical protein